jgi:hypothetical protein
MARLYVEARGTRATGDAGDEDRVVVVVSVSDEAGKPVAGLTSASFVIHSIAGPAGDDSVAVATVAAPADGVYVVDGAPAGGSWSPGRHVLSVHVARGFDRGQCLADLMVA